MIEWRDLSFEEQLAAARLGGPAEWSKLMNPDWPVPQFVRGISDIIKDEIERAVDTGNGGIILFSLPPGHNKSYLASINTPEWFLERWPSKRVAIIAYGHTRAQEWGEEIRNHIAENPDKFTIRLRRGTTAKARFHTDQGGGVLCTGIGGPLTGFRAHLVDIDDPTKDDEEAQSELIREKHWAWFRKVAITRRWPEATTMIVMTRWHEDDLVGRVQQLYAVAEANGKLDDLPPIKIIRIPCIAEEDDPIGREPGDLLWPEAGYDQKWATQTKAIVGSHVWTTMYQQRPSPEGGGQFRRCDFRYWSKALDGSWVLHHGEGNDERIQPTAVWKAQICDTAMKVKTANDWTVVGTFAITRHRQLIVLDVTRQRLEVPDQLPLIRSLRQRWKPMWTAIEDQGGGTFVIQEARRQGLALRPLKATTDKVTRASPASALYEQHQVFHLRDAPWLDAFEHELLAFPNGTHDDQVDVIAYMVRELAPTARYSGSSTRREPDGLVGITR